jgi:hypothetical protein
MMFDPKVLRNHLKEAIVRPDGHTERMRAIGQLLQREYGKPVAIGIVVGLQDGDGFDFMIAGNMDPDDIIRAAGHVNFMRDYAEREDYAKKTAPQPTDGPLSQIPPETWDNMPASLKNVLFAAASEGNLDVIMQDPLDDVPGATAAVRDLDDDEDGY